MNMSKEKLRMQRLAGLITESQYNKKLNESDSRYWYSDENSYKFDKTDDAAHVGFEKNPDYVYDDEDLEKDEHGNVDEKDRLNQMFSKTDYRDPIPTAEEAIEGLDDRAAMQVLDKFNLSNEEKISLLKNRKNGVIDRDVEDIFSDNENLNNDYEDDDLSEEWKSDFDGNRDFDEYYDDKKEFISKYGSIYDIVKNLDTDMSAFDSEIEDNIFGEFLNDELNTLTKFNLPQDQSLNGEKIRFKSSPNGNGLSVNIYTLPGNKYGYYSNFKDAYLMSNNKEQIIKLAAIEEKLFDYSRSSGIDKQTSRAESGWVD